MIDLLPSVAHLAYLQQPHLLRQRVEASNAEWVVIDEIQKVPALLDEIHALLNTHGRRYRFALTGSSARKLKKHDVNLLAGRAINRAMYPLTAVELGDAFALERALAYGTLPMVQADADSDRDRIDILEAYVANYIREEIQQEALVRNLASFARFLPIAALMNAQVTNLSSIARDAGVARQTVHSYFSVLEDTLVGAWLPAWQKKVRVRQVEHPKFFFFDTGATRAISGRVREPLDTTERGHLLEAYVFHELRAHVSYAGIGGELSYFRTVSGVEVDFIWSRGARHVGVEVKASKRVRAEHTKPLRTLLDERIITAAYLVYEGEEVLRDGEIWILPVGDFLERLSKGHVLDAGAVSHN